MLTTYSINKASSPEKAKLLSEVSVFEMWKALVNSRTCVVVALGCDLVTLIAEGRSDADENKPC